MITNPDVALTTADQLLQIKAIKLEPEKPFTWSSGWKSPIYCDNRISLSYPPLRTYLREQLATAVEKNFGKPDVIAGVATGAIAIGVLVAQAMNLPFVYVRPEAKSHGRRNKIEGHLEANRRVVVIEDLISTGGSSLKAVNALREAGHQVMGLAAIFTYGFDISEREFEKNKCPYITLSNYDNLLKQAIAKGFLQENMMEALANWRKDPANWKA